MHAFVTRSLSLLALAVALATGATPSPAVARSKPAAGKADKAQGHGKKGEKGEKGEKGKKAEKAQGKAGKVEKAKKPEKAEKSQGKAGKAEKAKKSDKAKKSVKGAKASRKAGGVVTDATRDGKPNVQSRQGIVLDLDTDEVLWARQPDTIRPIASISKLLAAIVVLEKGIDLDATQTMAEVDVKVGRRGAHSRLLTGYTLTNRDLLHAAMLGSDNRAVSAMGRSIGLDAAAFAAAMTAKAKEMGLKHTRYGDPTGLNEGNVSTAREVVEMIRYALKNETLASILRTTEYTAKYTAGRKPKLRAGEIHYVSTNKLLKGSPYKIFGGKTGYTDPAKYCFVVAGELDGGRKVAMAFLNGEGELTRFGDFRRVAAYLKKHPPTAVARPLDEAEVTEVLGAVLYKDRETAAAAEADAPVPVEPEGDAAAARPAPGGDRPGADEDAPR